MQEAENRFEKGDSAKHIEGYEGPIGKSIF
jgi:hypothetical protein